jgi:hypothetical protein
MDILNNKIVSELVSPIIVKPMIRRKIGDISRKVERGFNRTMRPVLKGLKRNVFFTGNDKSIKPFINRNVSTGY